LREAGIRDEWTQTLSKSWTSVNKTGATDNADWIRI